MIRKILIELFGFIDDKKYNELENKYNELGLKHKEAVIKLRELRSDYCELKKETLGSRMYFNSCNNK